MEGDGGNAPSLDPKARSDEQRTYEKRFAQCWIVPELAEEVCDDETVERGPRPWLTGPGGPTPPSSPMQLQNVSKVA